MAKVKSGPVQCPYCGNTFVEHVIYNGQDMWCQKCTCKCTAPKQMEYSKVEQRFNDFFDATAIVVGILAVVLVGIFIFWVSFVN